MFHPSVLSHYFAGGFRNCMAYWSIYDPVRNHYQQQEITFTGINKSSKDNPSASSYQLFILLNEVSNSTSGFVVMFTIDLLRWSITHKHTHTQKQMHQVLLISNLLTLDYDLDDLLLLNLPAWFLILGYFYALSRVLLTFCLVNCHFSVLRKTFLILPIY